MAAYNEDVVWRQSDDVRLIMSVLFRLFFHVTKGLYFFDYFVEVSGECATVLPIRVRVDVDPSHFRLAGRVIFLLYVHGFGVLSVNRRVIAAASRSGFVVVYGYITNDRAAVSSVPVVFVSVRVRARVKDAVPVRGAHFVDPAIVAAGRGLFDVLFYLPDYTKERYIVKGHVRGIQAKDPSRYRPNRRVCWCAFRVLFFGFGLGRSFLSRYRVRAGDVYLDWQRAKATFVSSFQVRVSGRVVSDGRIFCEMMRACIFGSGQFSRVLQGYVARLRILRARVTKVLRPRYERSVE